MTKMIGLALAAMIMGGCAVYAEPPGVGVYAPGPGVYVAPHYPYYHHYYYGHYPYYRDRYGRWQGP